VPLLHNHGSLQKQTHESFSADLMSTPSESGMGSREDLSGRLIEGPDVEYLSAHVDSHSRLAPKGGL
jgi:hypothetical protein